MASEVVSRKEEVKMYSWLVELMRKTDGSQVAALNMSVVPWVWAWEEMDDLTYIISIIKELLTLMRFT